MIRKRGFVLIFAVFVLGMFSLNVVSAETCDVANDRINQRIMRLSGETNAHGEVWNGVGGYAYDICYDSIFGHNYTGANPHGSKNNGANVVLKLSSLTNAHAAGPMGNYIERVFYGDFVCNLRQNSCLTGERVVVSLSAETNAHLGLADKYTNKICCSTPSIYWANYGGGTITEAGLGWSVKLVYESSSLTEGEDVVFGVYEDDRPYGGGPGIGDEQIITLTTKASGGRAIGEWNISQTDLNKAGSDLDNFFFWVKDRKSNHLKINPNEINTRPDSRIISPIHKGVYYVGQNIIFNHSSIDLEGPVVVEWEIGDALADKTKNSFIHAYSTAGQKIIKLKVKDREGEEDTGQISILVISSPGIFGFAEKPSTNEVIVSRELVVEFSGEDSYVIDSISSGSPCTTTVTCLGGNCPGKTQGSPSCSGNPSAQIDIGGTKGSFSNMFYYWVFSDGSQSLVLQEAGKSKGSKGYSVQGEKTISLSVNYSNLNSGIYSIPFTLYDQRQCTPNGAEWVNVEDGREVARYNTMNSNKCAGKDAIVGSDDDCCPVGFYCSGNGCRIENITSLVYCSNYRDAINCSNDPLRAARNNPLWLSRGCSGLSGMNNILCKCNWNNSRCEFGISVRNSNDLTMVSQCSYQTELGECEGGYQDVSIVATKIIGNDPSCVGSQEVVPCGRPMIQLPFFAWIQILTSLVVVGAVYFLLSVRRI